MSIPEHVQEQILQAINELPILSKEDLLRGTQDSCPICLQDFESILSESGQPSLSGPEDSFLAGVTKVEGCNHVFCRQDLSEWIRNLHGSCPTCRRPFVELGPFPADDESSDGGEYIPAEDLDSDEDEHFDDSFLTSEADFDGDTEDVELDLMEYDSSAAASFMDQDASDGDTDYMATDDDFDGMATDDAEDSSSIGDADEVFEAVQVEVVGNHGEGSDQSQDTSDEEPK